MSEILLSQKNRRWRIAFICICLLTNLCVATNAQQSSANQQLADSEAVFSIAFSPDGKTLAIGSGSDEYEKRYGQIELLDAETGKTLRTIRGFDGPVWSIVFSPDGKTIISGSSEFLDTKIQGGFRKGKLFAQLKWWDTQTGELKQKKSISDKERRAIMISSSPDGKSLASIEYYLAPSIIGNSSFNGKIKLLDAQTGEVKLKITDWGFLIWGWSSAYSREIFSASLRFLFQQEAIFSPDGQLLAARTPDNEVKIWNTQTGKVVHTLKKFSSGSIINSLTFSPDRQTLAIASTFYNHWGFKKSDTSLPKSEIRLYDTNTGKVKNTLTGQNVEVSSLKFTPDGGALLIGSYQYESESGFGNLKVLNMKSGEFTDIRVSEEQAIKSLALSPNGRLLAVRTASSVVVLDMQTWKVKYTFDNENDEVNRKVTGKFVMSVSSILSVAFSPDGKTLAGGGEKNEIKLWDPRTGEIKKTLKGHEGSVSTLAISPDGKTLLSGSLDKTVRLWDLQTGNQRAVLTPNTGPISSVSFSSDGQMFAIGGENVVTLWNTTTGELKQTLATHQTTITSVSFSNDNRMLASASEDGTIKVLDVKTGEIKKTLTADGKTNVISFSPDGQTLASANDNGIINLWDVQTGALKETLKKHDAPVNALAFSPDGQILASGSDDRTVIIWETSSGKSKRTLKGHDMTVTSIAFSPDGSLIASGSGNDSVVLWEVINGKLNRIIK